MICDRCGADHLVDGVKASEVPEEWCRGALFQQVGRLKYEIVALRSELVEAKRNQDHCPSVEERIKLTEERDDWQTKYEHVLGLLRDTKMKHGTCQPRSRKACTACDAQEILDQIVKDWKGFTMVLS